MKSIQISPVKPFVRTLAKGFSLVEVAVSLAIASLAITVLLGLTPAGLDAIREAGDTGAETAIVRQMVAEVQAADWGEPSGGTPGWSKLSDFDDERRYFDDQGTPLDSPNGAMVSYVSRFSFPNRSVVLPGGSAPAGSADMVYLTIDFAATPNPDVNFNTFNKIASRTLVIARQY